MALSELFHFQNFDKYSFGHFSISLGKNILFCGNVLLWSSVWDRTYLGYTSFRMQVDLASTTFYNYTFCNKSHDLFSQIYLYTYTEIKKSINIQNKIYFKHFKHKLTISSYSFVWKLHNLNLQVKFTINVRIFKFSMVFELTFLHKLHVSPASTV